jgi:hypothetical protein
MRFKAWICAILCLPAFAPAVSGGDIDWPSGTHATVSAFAGSDSIDWP